METVDEIYHKIGQSIMDNINTDDWKIAKLNIEVLGSSVGLKGYLEEDKRFDAPSDFFLSRSILNLHKITTENPKNKWNRAIFTLFPNGKFDMEFIWDQALQDEIEKLAKN